MQKFEDNYVSPQFDEATRLYVGRLILRPAKLTPQEFAWLDAQMTTSERGDKIVLRAKAGRPRGYFANGLVALSINESVRGLTVLVDLLGWRAEDWSCVEVTFVAAKFVKAIISTIPRERVEAYYRWVFAHPESQMSFDEWLAQY